MSLTQVPVQAVLVCYPASRPARNLAAATVAVTGALQAGKAAALFTSTATQGGGQETTLLTAVTQLAHHGIIYVPSGYGTGPSMFGMDTVRVSRVAAAKRHPSFVLLLSFILPATVSKALMWEMQAHQPASRSSRPQQQHHKTTTMLLW